MVTFVKHDDASQVTVKDVIAFKDHGLRTINTATGKRSRIFRLFARDYVRD